MKFISRNSFNNINEAIFGVRLSGYSKEDFERLNHTELTDALKQILLLSGGGFTTESITYLKHSLLKNNLLEESKFNNIDFDESVNEGNLNEEGWDDTVSDFAKATGAVGLAGAIGLGAYISFLSKKKKIRKAWEEVYKAKQDSADIDLETWEEKQALKPELTKDEVTDKVGQVETTKTNKKEELDQVDKNWDKDKQDAKEKLDDTKKILFELDPASYKDPTDKAADDTADDVPTTPPEAAPEAPVKDKTKDSEVKEADEEPTKTDDKKDGPMGDLQKAQQAVKDARPDEKEIEKEIIPIDKQIKGGIDKMTNFKGDAKAKEKAGKKWAKEKAKLQSNKEEIKDGSSNKELQSAKKELDGIKKQLESEQKRLEKRISDYKEYTDGSTKETKQKLKDEITELSDEIDKIKERGRPKGGASDIEDIDAMAKQKKENVTQEIQSLSDEADRVSGTSGGGKEAEGLAGKALGLKSGFTKQVKGELEKELILKKKANLEKMGDTIAANKMDILSKEADKKASEGGKELEDEKKKVDATDKERQEADDKVKAKQVKDSEKKQAANTQKTAELNKQIADLQSSDSKGKEEQITNLQSQINKLQTSESITTKFKLAILEAELKRITEKDKDAKEDNSNTLIDKKVKLVGLSGTDLSHLEGAIGVVSQSFKEGEREPEGDLPRREGDPEMFKVVLDNPQDKMYPDVNLPAKNIKIYTKKKEDKKEDTKEEKTDESFRSKFYEAMSEDAGMNHQAELENSPDTNKDLAKLKKLKQRLYDSGESAAVSTWESFEKRVIGKDGTWELAPIQSYPKGITELNDLITKYSIK